ncbi:DUF938 domain-containing protein [Sphingomonas changnyeongensis]|uniref:DUF938 domain-containing protein n=1 Tax=Sphingomonas changnyeongensis TaxID=2698679 RepID=A0A7Z2NVH8_9SPHN|nr:DUF938 domain-containing protein [Sphingomonas changnyeongensis]QHL90576.1 DUF938 domain-containing protein [Sphingomonas changnyeongensis]
MTADAPLPDPPAGQLAADPSGARHAPATLRNRDAILAILQPVLPPSGLVLELASGSGEHARYFATHLPGLVFQPSDPDPDARASIAAWCAGLANVRPPLALDVTAPDWADDHSAPGADACVCINMVHISPWAATIGLFRGCARLLPAGAPLILYGPYLEAGIDTAPSNLAFDQSLKARNPDWGLRHLDDVDRLAAEHGFARTGRHDMPANNLTLIYRRQPA